MSTPSFAAVAAIAYFYRCAVIRKTEMIAHVCGSQVGILNAVNNIVRNFLLR